MALDGWVYVVMRKGEKYVRLSIWLAHHTKGHEIASFRRGTGTWVEGQHAKDGPEKKTDCASHAEARELLHAEAKKLFAKGHIAEMHPFLKLDEEAMDIVTTYGGSLTTPAVGMDRIAPIFRISRGRDKAISPEEDRALRRLADAVGLTAQDPQTKSTVLHIAADCSSVSLAEACLAAGASPDTPDRHDRTPRSNADALSPKNPARAKLLALFEARGGPAALTARDLCQAAERGDLDLVNQCLAAGVSADAKEPTSHKSALFWAARSAEPSALQVIDRLLANSANPNADADGGVLEAALGQRRDPALSVPRLQRLIAAGARAEENLIIEWLGDTSYPAESRRTLVSELRRASAFSAKIPLEAAVTMRDVEAVRAALAAGADPNEKQTVSLLHLAAADGGYSNVVGKRLVPVVTMPANAEIVELLLKAGANPDARASRDDDFQVEGFESVAGNRAERAMESLLETRDARSAERERIVKAIVDERIRRNGGVAPADDAGSSDSDDEDFDE